MSFFEVDPSALHSPAADCERVSQALAEAARALVSRAQADTGAAAGTAQAAAVVQVLASAVQALSQAAAYDARALRAAGARYVTAERQAVAEDERCR